ncbi:A/G-specific adenine glycosylase [Alkalilimnicola ehrlichii MLHE-1]|uniref:Adenine DNA glycosylase n=1 Tax=Alkalilimnicola ehrlichii (strain ATCC BAA-1101 / DSM 17681 / MLHE-1) TaxID=187272 RepID=Q0A552_ALKEH|nr:A/G-specific adenine glycosylase [Alkalilimnicola ehrlichii]ABI58035.1 A/G-specific DNA-adenine glycosylase [Alkalilimnicola ehrlichii MLHE-1]
MADRPGAPGTEEEAVNRTRAAILAWFDRHGRHDLPWQHPATPYRVWVSEVMLQQTQVATVVPYFHRFMRRFPSPRALADAPQEEVLALWAGLGYYARARNLHRAAQHIRDQYGGELPADLDALEALPGIGRSTAGAIHSLGQGRRAVILDGNVKRVLARWHAVDGWPGRTAVARRLWALAEHYTPAHRCADYNQAMMDLGATVCTRRTPRCHECPLQARCAGHASGRPEAWPTPKPKRRRPLRQTRMLILQHGDRVLLQRRPPSGVWGGLWSLPEAAVDADPKSAAAALGLKVDQAGHWPPLRHAFSHFELDIHPIHLRVSGAGQAVKESDTLWQSIHDTGARAVAAPVARLLERLREYTP